ncbi:MAG: alpha/beta fold hydrolase [Rhodospirillaceae bacterium]|jgi:uncharacterized OsmC-like protein/alpha/beta superfamily hydrolase|nr:alpha/beta fold hydrolase [Rhodospirillaceae bacterium]MBT5243703.1 alpha/beta fold hydrolase [Rhodospirillaceae bacterium]MBT5563800.1 alpha/beta fold hydrolase [Rhodospirillaceae bacterium]MBT6241711.1 alpha/beta fold hydrolase [Rhodospirillaceae bacterium]MBT7138201.1 alpha/beta fold hydrolase [Rhodospirillaceae bacterium]
MAAATQRLVFPGSDGDLSARLDMPPGQAKAYALFAHCFTCTKDIYAANRISERLTLEGIAVLRFDFTGLGASEGEFANSNFSSNISDLVCAADYMRDHFMAPSILIGHSLGGAAVLAATSLIPETKAVATIGAPADPAHVVHNFQAAIGEIEANGEAEVLLAGRPFRIKKQFIEDIQQQNMEAAVNSLNAALLIFHAPMDQTVGIENAAQIFQSAKHPKSFVSLDDADHLISRREDAVYVADVISAWAERYIGNAGLAANPAPVARPGTVVVAETGTGKFTNVIVTGSGHILNTDEPQSVGGDDSGPTPYDLLLSALGACKSMTMRMYAERKGYKLGRAEVRLSHSKIHSDDCEACETENGKIDRIQTEISITGDLSQEERQSIFEIAERCPVHRTITGEILIEASLNE